MKEAQPTTIPGGVEAVGEEVDEEEEGMPGRLAEVGNTKALFCQESHPIPVVTSMANNT